MILTISMDDTAREPWQEYCKPSISQSVWSSSPSTYNSQTTHIHAIIRLSQRHNLTQGQLKMQVVLPQGTQDHHNKHQQICNHKGYIIIE